MRSFSIWAVVCAFVSAIGACGSVTPLAPYRFGVSDVEPGKSRAKEVEARLGQPAEKAALANGDSVWFYPKNSAGRQTIAVQFSADGVVRSVEERLEPEVIRKIVPEVTTMRQVRELLGPPYQVKRLGVSLPRDVWRYLFYDQTQEKRTLDLQFSADGVVREIYTMRDALDFSGAY